MKAATLGLAGETAGSCQPTARAPEQSRYVGTTLMQARDQSTREVMFLEASER
jgi:hypothetical protein